jgi:putative membrane protein
MKNRTALVGAVCAAIALSATAAQAQVMSSGSMMPSSQDKTFAMKASMTNEGEIAGGRLALMMGTGHTVKTLAQHFIDNHTTNEAKLSTIASKENISLPMTPSPADKKTAAHLKTLSGRAFDMAYLQAQQKGHLKAVALYKQEIATGTNPMLVAYAKKSLPVIEEHLELATDDAGKMMHMAANSGM